MSAEKLCYLLIPGQDQTVPLFLKLRAQEKVGRQLSCREKLLCAAGSNREQAKHWGRTGRWNCQGFGCLSFFPPCPGQHRSACGGGRSLEEAASCHTHGWVMFPGLRGDSLLRLGKKFVFICLQFALPYHRKESICNQFD